jgi:hypothetical protein
MRKHMDRDRLPTIFTTVSRQELANLGNILITNTAKVAELADAPDLGTVAATFQNTELIEFTRP